MDIKWLKRNIPEHLQDRMTEGVPQEGSGSHAGKWFPVWLYSERCSIHQSLVHKMFLLLQFGREYRGGRGLNMAEDRGQRTQRQDTEYLDLRGAPRPHTCTEAIPRLKKVSSTRHYAEYTIGENLQSKQLIMIVHWKIHKQRLWIKTMVVTSRADWHKIETVYYSEHDYEASNLGLIRTDATGQRQKFMSFSVRRN